MQRHRFSWCFLSRTLAAAAILACIQSLTGCRSAQSGSAAVSPADSTETIVMIRHGEKPPGGLGQISCRGLNRALALPDLLIGRYGKPDFVYAPNPSFQVTDNGRPYSYVRPLATLEPTAVRAGVPVNTQFGYTQIDELQKALTQPAYANSHVLVAWEHDYLHSFAQQLLKSYGDDPSVVPAWPAGDYDTIYVFELARSNGKAHLTFHLDHEGLNNSLSDACPAGGTR
jgi:hypothetical protein